MALQWDWTATAAWRAVDVWDSERVLLIDYDGSHPQTLMAQIYETGGILGVFAAQEIKLQARVLAEDRGIRCVILDYKALRGIEPENTLF
jgi:hypothetical protein